MRACMFSAQRLFSAHSQPQTRYPVISPFAPLLRSPVDIDNRERERVIRQAKQEEEWEQRARAIERQEATVHHLKVEEEKRQREKRLFQDKMIDNRELERVKREAKRDEEWEVRARQIEQEEMTLHHMKVEEEKRKKEKRLKQDKVSLWLGSDLSTTNRSLSLV